MREPTLFDLGTMAEQPMRAPAHHSAPQTSRDAAELIEPTTASLRAKVLRFLTQRWNQGATDEEGQVALGMSPNTYRPRRRELVQLGLVVESPFQRSTASGRRAVVWVAATLKSLEKANG